MAKKTTNTDKSAFDTPDYEALATVGQVEEELAKHKEILVGKDLIERRIKADKKDLVAGYNEQLKELAEEREHEMGVLGALEDRKKQIHAANVIPMTKRS